MARPDEPLLARPPSDHSGDADVAEEDALLTGQTTSTKPTDQWRRIAQIILAAWAVIATVAVIVLAVLFAQSGKGTVSTAPNPSGKRNLIFMVSDGMGPTSLSLTRSFKQYRDGTPYSDALVLDGYVIGQSRTRSTSSLITDSAAGATAFSCGLKSYNGAISTLPDHSPCGTVMEAAKKAGYMTGLVVTTRITDATPACFAAHVNKREEEDRIAEQLLGDYPLGRVVDLMIGAGRCHFLPNTTTGSCRKDDKDMVAKAKSSGYQYIDNREDFDGLMLGSAVNLPLLGLFADHDIPYEIDRAQQNDVYPSLDEMAQTALKALSEATRDSDKGFFLMIEGSRIDHAGHTNDAVAQVHEVLAYDRAFQTVLEFLEKDTVQGVVVSTSDHETGGLSTARQLDPYIYPEYRWNPAALANASHSAEWLSADYARHLSATSSSAALTPRDATAYLHAAIPAHLGIHDVTDAEIDTILSHASVFAPWLFSDLVSRRSQNAWGTHGHSAADVNIYASDANVAKSLRGNVENTQVGVFLREYLDVDVDKVTEELRGSRDVVEGVVTGVDGEEGKMAFWSWMGQTPLDGERLDGQNHLELGEDHTKDHSMRVVERGEECGCGFH